MTDPTILARMPLAYPDTEKVLLDLFDLLPVLSVTWLPNGWVPPIHHINRIGGGPDPWDVTDYALVRVSSYGATRDESWSLSADAERLILGHSGRRTPSGYLIDFTALDVGGSQEPDLDPDERRVTKNFTIGMRRQYDAQEA